MTSEDIKKLARLARLELTDAEYRGFADELTAILEYVAALCEVDTEGAAITSQVTGLTNVFREDSVEASPITDALLKVAPQVEDGGVCVKSVF